MRLVEKVKTPTWAHATAGSFFVVGALAATLMPSTKTLCAMFVVPAIVNSQAVQKDFPELYALAVEKLKSQLTPELEKSK